ncbi:hypothetical protein EBH_0074010 [Eimeria brunetti]|uniref:Uncharacterized protein n=1 Tax=Eimeria brunetti TaxID=51314 RepID=U6LN92_9EIME|nr:hypothetical protein EBH_0074010 [Eimeria brunetti]
MCGGWNGGVTRDSSAVGCPFGTYTKQEFPGICIPCPPGFQCPDPQGVPEPCPPGTNSLGGRRECSPAPAGSIVERGKEHLPPRPCEEGLRPLELAGQWWCGIGYDDASEVLDASGRPARSSATDNLVISRSSSIPDLCKLEDLDYLVCSQYTQPTKWCPIYSLSSSGAADIPPEFFRKPFFLQGGAFAEWFVSCGYTRSLDDTERVRHCS